MSRKHYVKVAAMIAAERAGAISALSSEALSAEGKAAAEAVLASTANLASGLAGMFASDNPAFSRGQFYEAALVTGVSA